MENCSSGLIHSVTVYSRPSRRSRERSSRTVIRFFRLGTRLSPLVAAKEGRRGTFRFPDHGGTLRFILSSAISNGTSTLDFNSRRNRTIFAMVPVELLCPLLIENLGRRDRWTSTMLVHALSLFSLIVPATILARIVAPRNETHGNGSSSPPFPPRFYQILNFI